MKWTTTWPTQPGLYWFYGQLWSRTRAPEYSSVRVRTIGDGSLIYVTHGNFMYSSEKHAGWWQPAVLPDLPDHSNTE